MDIRKEARLRTKYERLRLENVEARRSHREEAKAVEIDPSRNPNARNAWAAKLEAVHRKLVETGTELKVSPDFMARLEPLPKRIPEV